MRRDLIERLREHANENPEQDIAEWVDFASLYMTQAAAALEAEASEGERLRSALRAIAHTFTENSHGGMKTLPASYYQEIARRALIPEAPAQRELGSAAANQISTPKVGLPEALAREGWQPIKTAPKDGTVVWVWCPAYEGLRALTSLCSWHEDAGWCVDELRTPTMWRPLQVPASPPQDREEQ